MRGPSEPPEAFYNCSTRECQETTYPAEMLRWCEDIPDGRLRWRDGWYCEACIEHWLPEEYDEENDVFVPCYTAGPWLDDYLKSDRKGVT